MSDWARLCLYMSKICCTSSIVGEKNGTSARLKGGRKAKEKAYADRRVGEMEELDHEN